MVILPLLVRLLWGKKKQQNLKNISYMFHLCPKCPFLLKKFTLFKNLVCVCLCVRICAHKSRKLEMPESLELETQVLVSYLTRVLETELKSVLNHFSPPPADIS